MLDLQVYKKQLENLRNEFTQRIDALSSDIHHKEEAVEKDFAEQATQSENDEVLNALDNEARTMVIQINKALLRIKNERYGVCTSCGSNINEQRLQTIPYAALCIECAEKEQSH
jgi:RNA polymerase-binding transcription factor